MADQPETWRTKFKKDSLSTIAIEAGKWIWNEFFGLSAAKLALAVFAAAGVVLSRFSDISPLFMAVGVLWLMAGGLALLRLYRWRTEEGKSVSAAKPSTPPKEPDKPVEFIIPSKWDRDTGFVFTTIGKDKFHRDICAEEVRVEVVAKRRLEDVRFEMSIRHRRHGKWEEIAQIGSEKFQGVVPKDMRQTFVVMRRTFSMVPATYQHLDVQENTVSCLVRAEREVMFFPENPAAAKGNIGEAYMVEIVVYHDHSEPDKAAFRLMLTETRVPTLTMLDSRNNIAPVVI